MYTMKQACDILGITSETLRFYCDKGLIPDVGRDKNNYRNFSEKNIKWIESLLCLRQCGMSIKDMKLYLALCLQGKSSIHDRKEMLRIQKCLLEQKKQEILDSIAYIDRKQQYFDDILEGRMTYTSNLPLSPENLR